MHEWLTQSAAELGRGIAGGRIDPVDLARAYLDAIAAHPDAGRIYARVTETRALAEAHAARERARLGLRRSLLDGVPISWKDLCDSAGVATEAGSALLSGRVPERDAQVLANATASGAVCLGKTHLTELAFSGLGYNPSTATPPNVNDPGAVPGGSSSGAAASVAFGLAAAGIGSDTGGSVRVPAAWNDLVGLKTTVGRLSLRGVVELAEHFDTIGPLTRTVEDAALLTAMMEGARPPDLRGASLKGRRLAVLRTVAMDDLRDAPRDAFQSALERLQAGGAVVDHIDIPEVAEAMGLASLVFVAQAYGRWRDTIEARPDLMFAQIRDRFRIGANGSGADYYAAWRRLHEIRALYGAATAGYDAVVCPTAANLPPNLDRLRSDDGYFVTENLLTLRNTRIGNLMGLCALTLPTGVPSCGLMVMSPAMTEAKLLRIGAAAEAALA